MTRRLLVWLGLSITATTMAAPAAAQAQTCVGGLSKVEYPNGFSVADFTVMNNVQIANPPPNQVVSLGPPVAMVTSAPVSTEIPAPAGNYNIGKLLLHATAAFPAPCPPGATLGGASSTRVDITFSVDGTNYYPVTFPAGTTTDGTVLIDPMAMGVFGSVLSWRATLLTNQNGCQPRLTDLSLGYQGIPAGVFQSTEPIPAGNVVIRTSYELASSTWTDRRPRGHVQAKVLYSLDTVPLTDYTDPFHTPPNAWNSGDAGATILAAGPDNRLIYYYNKVAAATRPFTQAIVAATDLLPNAARNVQYLGQYVYDLDQSGGQPNDNDAWWLLAWIRGWANGTTRSQLSDWGLGAIHYSTPAVVSPPGDPWWLSLNGTPAAERTLFGTPCADSPEPAPPPAPVLPATPASPTFLQARRFRDTLAVVGGQDGLIHAFDLGKFRWCDDLSTAVVETRGWFSYRGARNYGDGHEVWAFAPAAQLGIYRRQPQRAMIRPWAVSQGLPMASMDASINAADACLGPTGPANPPPGGNPSCTYHTVILAAETREVPFITAIDYLDPAITPKALWPEDWPPASENDTTFQGTEVGVSMGPTLARAANGTPARKWVASTTSGMSSTPTDLYLYLIDLQSGKTLASTLGVRDGFGRVKLNVAGANADCSGQVNGSAGPPVLVDSDSDGVADRVYVTDTKGCLYKVETRTMTACVMASLGETVYAPMAVRVADDIASRIEIFVGGGDDPATIDIPANQQYHLFSLEDDDIPGNCTPPKMLFQVPLSPGGPGGAVHKMWTGPTVASDAVYVATSVGELNDECGGDTNNPGVLEGWEITPSVQAGPRQVLPPVSLGGNAVGGVRLFDGHLFVNTSRGSTTVFGRPGAWATSITSVNANGGTVLNNPQWIER